jgi:hypothetical protein
MFQRMIDDFKHNAGATVRMSSLAAAAGFALFITLIFLCAAAFVAVLQRYGLIEACLTVAGIFLVIAAILGIVYGVKTKRARQRAIAAARAAAASKSSASSLLADPMLLATGLQLVRALGLKKLIPLLAVGGIALGIFAGRNASSSSDDEQDDGEEES